MYTTFYQLSRKPFELNPDPGVIFLSETHQEALSVLRYGVLNRKGFLQLTGNVGTGKSTLLQSLIRSLDSNAHLCYIPNPNFTVQEFYYFVGAKFGLDEYDGNKAKFIISLGRFLQRCKVNNEYVLLIIDEAQVLSLEVLEEVRLISNQEFYDDFGVLSIFLVGQPELNVLLGHQKLLPLRNRIGITFNIKPLTLEETTAYIQFRLRKAGRRSVLFSPDAYRAIHRSTGGIPRTINILCDNALLAGFAEQRGIIDGKIIRDCARELRQAEQELQEVEDEPAETEKKEKVSTAAHIPDEPKKRYAFFQPGRVALSAVILLIVFAALMVSTDYWGSVPGAAPAKAWFEKLHVQINERILLPVKKMIMARKYKSDLSSAEKVPLPAVVDKTPELSEEKNNTENSITDKKKLLLRLLKQTSLQKKQFQKLLQLGEILAQPIMSISRCKLQAQIFDQALRWTLKF